MNGYHIESDPKAVVEENDELRYTFLVKNPSGKKESCTVVLPSVIMLEIKEISHCETMPGDKRFWHALCEHVLSNYLYQAADYPPDFIIRVDEVDRSIRNWVKAAIKSAGTIW